MTADNALARIEEKIASRLARLRANLDNDDDLVTWERGRIEGLQVALEDVQLIRGIVAQGVELS